MKSKYETHVEPNLILVEKWTRDGATDNEIYTRLGISETSFYKYKRKHAEFAEALKRGKEVVDTEVENALLKRALGFTYEETTTEIADDGTTKTKTVTKQALPDNTSMVFWLKNRMPELWRDKTHVETEAKVEAKISPYTNLSTEELKALADNYLNNESTEE